MPSIMWLGLYFVDSFHISFIEIDLASAKIYKSHFGPNIVF